MSISMLWCDSGAFPFSRRFVEDNEQEQCQGNDHPPIPVARIMHETPSRDRGDGRATGQPQGLAPEAYLFSTSQGARPEDARKDGHLRGRSRWFVHNAG